MHREKASIRNASTADRTRTGCGFLGVLPSGSRRKRRETNRKGTKKNGICLVLSEGVKDGNSGQVSS